MMTLVSSARRHDLDVWVYIKDVLDQLLAGSTDYHSLLPDVWKQTHQEAVRDYRVEERRDKAERKQLQRGPPPPRRPQPAIASRAATALGPTRCGAAVRSPTRRGTKPSMTCSGLRRPPPAVA